MLSTLRLIGFATHITYTYYAMLPFGNISIIAVFFDHAANGETLHGETITEVNESITGRLHLNNKDLEKWTNWVEKVVSQPEATLR